MRINDENLLREMRKNPDKRKRVNSYEHRGLLYNQGYDHSTDVYNPFFVHVYKDNSYLMGGSGATIEEAYHNLIHQSLLYMQQYRDERNDYANKVGQVLSIFKKEIQEDFGYDD